MSAPPSVCGASSSSHQAPRSVISAMRPASSPAASAASRHRGSASPWTSALTKSSPGRAELKDAASVPLARGENRLPAPPRGTVGAMAWIARRAPLALLAAALAVALSTPPGGGAAAIPTCAPGGPPVVLAGSVGAADARTYRTLPFDVTPGTTRVEVGFAWADAGAPAGAPSRTVLDLGLWDADGVGTPAGFRGWSGSRQGRIADGQAPVWVQADTAERGYRPGPVEPGTWNVDLGIATVAPGGASWRVEVRCLAVPVGPAFVPHPVDPTHVARAVPGWYFGDFHMHGYHSNPHGPDWDRFVAYARAAGLDFLPVTEYVTNQHWDELGPVQEANPDLLIWPGREIVTYYGHVTALGETPSVIDWRVGAPAPSLTIGEIQRRSRADGALFQVNHPTIFPHALFGDLCRGSAVDTMEILTGHVLVDPREYGMPAAGPVENPFMRTAIAKWDGLLAAGDKITAVSGSDDKLGPGYGTSATAVYADQLSRPALKRAIRAGHVYVRTRGVHGSPSLELTAVAPDGERGMFGDTFEAPRVRVSVRVRGGRDQVLTLVRDGVEVAHIPITSDDFTHRFTAWRAEGSGPLGTAWRVQTSDAQSLTTVGNPIFLR